MNSDISIVHTHCRLVIVIAVKGRVIVVKVILSIIQQAVSGDLNNPT